MRKKTIHNGMRLILVSLLIIIIASFYLGGISDVLALSFERQARFYQGSIFISAAMGSYGVVLTAFGLILPARKSDLSVSILPLLLLIFGVISLFFYLLAGSFESSNDNPKQQRLRPGETITI